MTKYQALKVCRRLSSRSRSRSRSRNIYFSDIFWRIWKTHPNPLSPLRCVSSDPQPEIRRLVQVCSYCRNFGTMISMHQAMTQWHVSTSSIWRPQHFGVKCFKVFTQQAVKQDTDTNVQRRANHRDTASASLVPLPLNTFCRNALG